MIIRESIVFWSFFDQLTFEVMFETDDVTQIRGWHNLSITLGQFMMHKLRVNQLS